MTEDDKRCRTCRCAALRARNARWTSLALLGGRLSLRLRPRLDDIGGAGAAARAGVRGGRTRKGKTRQHIKGTFQSASAESLFVWVTTFGFFHPNPEPRSGSRPGPGLPAAAGFSATHLLNEPILLIPVTPPSRWDRAPPGGSSARVRGGCSIKNPIILVSVAPLQQRNFPSGFTPLRRMTSVPHPSFEFRHTQLSHYSSRKLSTCCAIQSPSLFGKHGMSCTRARSSHPFPSCM